MFFSQSFRDQSGADRRAFAAVSSDNEVQDMLLPDVQIEYVAHICNKIISAGPMARQNVNLFTF